MSIQDVYVKFQSFIDNAKAAASDGITWSEVGEIIVSFLRLAIETLDTLAGLTGAEKKAIVVDFVAKLFDAVADKAIPFPLWPIWIVVRPAIRSLVLALAAGAVESLLPLIRGK